MVHVAPGGAGAHILFAPLELEVESWGPLGHSHSAFSADIHPQLACCFPGLFSPGPTWLLHPAPRALHLLQRQLLWVLLWLPRAAVTSSQPCADTAHAHPFLHSFSFIWNK